jgi:hypothetical protein
MMLVRKLRRTLERFRRTEARRSFILKAPNATDIMRQTREVRLCDCAHTRSAWTELSQAFAADRVQACWGKKLNQEAEFHQEVRK